jgi:glutamate/tyrosine decarboxylase-like PLP-dependent enzyme
MLTSTPRLVRGLNCIIPESSILVLYFAEAVHTRCNPIFIMWSAPANPCKGISILADMWHAPSSKQAIGTATTGSSEAIQLGGLAMKKIWQEKRKAAGKSIHEPG